MAVLVYQTETPHAAPNEGAVSKVLIVDDSKAQRRILSSYLNRWGFTVLEAASGMEALDVVNQQNVDLIVSDWMMPGMDGIDFCREFRSQDRDSYSYFILLTSKSEKAEVARGLDVGADDFLTKPVSGDELLARLRAGERILKMQRELTEKNDLLTDTLKQISSLYDSLDRDLVEARKLQQSLVRDRFRDFGPAQVSLLLRPSGHVGGDLVGFFQIGKDQVACYSIDVSGHGVASALMTARLAAYLSGWSPERNLAMTQDKKGKYFARSPSEVAERLNCLLLEEMETEHYFTMILAYCNVRTGQVRMTQCGHPHPVVQRANGKVEYVGSGGLPIGLIPGAVYENFEIQLDAGDRVLLYSDGITECPDGQGHMLEEDGLTKILKKHHELPGTAFFEAMLWDLNNFARNKDFPDDISALFLEFSAP